MTSWLRSLRVTGVLIVLSAGMVVPAYGGDRAYAAESSPPASPAPSHSASASASEPAAEPSRAGSRPGEGRERPGRRNEAEEAERVDTEAAVPEDGEAAEEDEGADGVVDGDQDGGVTAVPEPPRETAAALLPPHPARPAEERAARPAEPALRIMPLGGGLILVGLGLGLAFVALRVRRAAP